MNESQNHDEHPEPLLSNIQRIVQNEPAFRAFLHKRLGDRTLAEDLYQQCLLRALQHQHSIENQESVVPWFYRVLRNALIDYYRSRASHQERHSAFEKDAQVLQEQDVPSLDDVKGTICQCMDQVLDTLRPNYADLIRRIDLSGEQPSAVAKDLAITPNNATVRLHRARQALRASLEATCGICTKHGCLNCTCT
ncbi:RNA polymerase sigma factor SigZ [Nitrospira sp.]|nr:RNA polymerase sigma factor SigZ [Nitrospira sp.]